jgi:hypothetical protein
MPGTFSWAAISLTCAMVPNTDAADERRGNTWAESNRRRAPSRLSGGTLIWQPFGHIRPVQHTSPELATSEAAAGC